MKSVVLKTATVPIALAALLACDTDSESLVLAPRTHSFASSEWTVPVNLGSPINSSAREIMPALSADGLSLYFVSNRGGGFGGNDIWVSHRSSIDSPWETAVNLGPNINTESGENNPSLSRDSRLLFFDSNRPGGHGRLDIYVSRRVDVNDDHGWATPVNLGPRVNTSAGDRGPDHVVVSPSAPALLYFSRGIGLQQSDMYAVPLSPDGEALGMAELLPELNAAGAVTDAASLRADAREIFFWSNRPGGLGASADLWTSTRQSPTHAWSSPQPLGDVVNSAFAEERPELSHDGRVLLFDSDRPDGLGGQDIWMSTRTPSGH